MAADKRQSGKTGFLTKIKTFLERNRLGELMVMTGFITPDELRFALNEHKRTGLPLGQVLLTHALISRRQLARVLVRQTILRGVSAILMCILGFSGMGSGRAHADMLDNQQPMSISFNVAASGAYAKMDSYPTLFGTAEKRSGDLGAFTKWSGVFSRMQRELQTPEGRAVMQQVDARLSAYKDLPLKSMAAKVNDMMNEKPYIIDSKNWGQSDYWETVVEFMQRGGDCEDFAIAKYTALKELGVPEDRMRVVIVQDQLKNIPHAILVVYTEEGPYILDNQNKSIVDGSEAGRYKPIFSINREAWWLHTSPGTQIASR